MSRVRKLVVWLHGEPLAELTEVRSNSHKLTFSDEAIARYGSGARPLSLSLPLPQDHKGVVVNNFLNGLLPEGQVRTEIARSLDIPQGNIMRMLDAVGKDCAGAVQVLPEDHTPREGFVESMSDADLASAVASLPLRSAPVQQASLGGIQEKLLVAKTDDGWGWPREGAASTHIIKPQPGLGFPAELVRSESWALEVANAAGLPSAATYVQDFDGREAIVIERYDRIEGRRIHQEDLCQALGLDVTDKYESDDDEGRLLQVAKLAAPFTMDEQDFRADLLKAVTYNVAIGNGDAHSKNYSLLLHENGLVELAPLYDVAPVWFLDERARGTGHRINGKKHIEEVTVDDLVAEASSWGMSIKSARRVATETIERTIEASRIVPTPEGLDGLPDRIANAPLALDAANSKVTNPVTSATTTGPGRGKSTPASTAGSFKSKSLRRSTHDLE